MPSVPAWTHPNSVQSSRKAPALCARRAFPKQSVVKTVVARAREKLTFNQFRVGERHKIGVRMSFQEKLGLQLVLLLEHRAGDVKQFTIASQHLPNRVEQGLLEFCELRDVAFAAQPFGVGMTPHDP